jgi:hypothetical protein
MLNPGGNGGSSFEIEASPRGVVFDTRYDSRRVPTPLGTRAGTVRLESRPLGAAPLDHLEPDAGYTPEMAIPWHAFSLNGSAVAPVPGTE